MDSAELYMMLIRPSMIPVVGEAWTIPFNLQVELGTWAWKISNAEELRNASKTESKFSELKSDMQSRQSARTAVDLQKKLAGMQAGFEADDLLAAIEKAKKIEDKDRRERELSSLQLQISNKEKFVEKKVAEFATELQRKARGDKTEKDRLAKQRENATRDLTEQIADAAKENFQFRFSKRVDFASTQMLNSMKQGDVFPTGIITLFQRAPNLNHAASLILTVTKLRLLDYKLRCEVSETMTDMREDWVCEFDSLGYVYKSRGQIKTETGAGQMITAALTQGTPRAFAMKSKLMMPI